MDSLKTISCPNFQWHSTHIQLEDRLFLHGDLPMDNKPPFSRQLEAKHSPQSATMHGLYHRVVQLKLHRITNVILTPSYCVKKVYRSIDLEQPDLFEHIRHIYFGHTHQPFNNVHYRGVLFHNTGSAIKHMAFNPIEVRHETTGK